MRPVRHIKLHTPHLLFTQTPHPAMKHTILVVDDTPENLDMMSALLLPDYQVKLATNGKMALKIIEGQQPDLVLLDVMMPDMDGYEVYHHIVNDLGYAHMPVIFVTAKAELESEVSALAMGAVDYITKPIRAEILKARIHTQLQLRDAYQTIAAQNLELKKSLSLRENIERINRHDLKAPLNIVLNVPEMLKEELTLDSEQLELLNLLEKAGKQMLNMVNNSLQLYHIETGKYEAQLDTINVIALLEQIIQEQQAAGLAQNIPIDLNLNPPDFSGSIIAERVLCYSIFSNLLKNALEASPAGGYVNIDIEPNTRCHIQICNQGAVPEALIPHFFEKYITAGKQDGTGLGTYSAKLMTEAQGGHISMKSSQQKNCTCVALSFPLNQGDN